MLRPCSPGDPVYTEGYQAWLSMKGERDCPYVDDTSMTVPQVGWSYWETAAGKRQRWFAGFNDIATQAHKRGTLEVIADNR